MNRIDSFRNEELIFRDFLRKWRHIFRNIQLPVVNLAILSDKIIIQTGDWDQTNVWKQMHGVRI